MTSHANQEYNGYKQEINSSVKLISGPVIQRVDKGIHQTNCYPVSYKYCKIILKPKVY